MKGQIAGKSPICLCGKFINGKREFIAVPLRCGLGLQVVKNITAGGFKAVHTLEDAHEMIINCMQGTDTSIFACGYGGAVKKWNLDLSLAGEVCVPGICANTLALKDESTVFVGFTDGTIRKISF
jgi:hypothetical protein